VLSEKSLRFLLPMILLALLLTSCGGAAPSGTYIWIDVPIDGLSFPDVQPIMVKGHATGDTGLV